MKKRSENKINKQYIPTYVIEKLQPLLYMAFFVKCIE